MTWLLQDIARMLERWDVPNVVGVMGSSQLYTSNTRALYLKPYYEPTWR